jgi:TonB family protein
MNHGVEGFFHERARARRRVSLIALGLAALLLIPQLALMIPSFRKPIRDAFRNTTRFGYEGPDQYVHRITLQQFHGSQPVLRDVGAVNTRREKIGGALKAKRSEDPHARPETEAQHIGPGESDEDLMLRTVSRLANVPVVQSHDLIILFATKPQYPEAELEHGIEGKVMVQALIDTGGRVVDVQLLGTTGVPAFERSSADAVWLYRFRPYREEGVPKDVYAIFRFAFQIQSGAPERR